MSVIVKSASIGPNIVYDGLVLYLDAVNTKSYPGTGTVWYDISNNNYDFTLYNSVTYNTTNNSFNFNGTNNYGKITDVIVSSPTELTIGGWIMNKNVGVVTYECALHQSLNTSIGSSSYWFGLQTGTGVICATIGANTGAGWSAGLTNITAQYDNWYHVVASWNGTIVRVYVNGQYNKQYNLASYSNLTTPTRIGASGDGTSYQFGGEISQIFIYDKYLTDSDVLQNYNATKNRFDL